MNQVMRIWAVSFVCVILIGSAADAQPNLNFKRITVNWPKIELYFSVGCNGNPAYNMTKQDFKISENGLEINDFTLWCPDPTVRCASSVALVFDASGSMNGTGNAGAKAAGRAFVDQMDGVIDEAAIIWFTSVVNIQQQMTTLKPLLYSAVDALPASGGTAVWDGIYAGIIELINNGINQCRAVIVISDGGDNASTRTPAEIISLANRNRIRVFTTGLGSAINATELEMIALLTGGRYYQTPNAGQLAAIYKDISTIIFQGFQECVITYDRRCADGGLRTVELQLDNFCGGTDVKTKTYRAPLDASTFSNLVIDLADIEGSGDSEIRVPVNLMTVVDPPTVLYPLQFDISYDAQYLQFLRAEAPPGSLLEGVNIDATTIAGGMRIHSRDLHVVQGSGLLMDLVFQAANPVGSISRTVDVADPAFEQGCFTPIMTGGTVRINPRVPIITCDINMPGELSWYASIQDYFPNPFTVTGRFSNSGGLATANTRYRITYDPDDVELVSPTSDEQDGSPKEISPGNYSEVIWQVAAKHRSTGDTTVICITATMDNHEEVSCCQKMYIPPRESALECSVEVPEIQIRSDKKGYTPMPFTVRAGLKNTGSASSGTVKARIYPPPGYSLRGTVSERQATKGFTPSTLSPGKEAFVEWYLDYPVTAQGDNATIQIEFYEDDESVCSASDEVTIPALDIPFAFTLDATGPLTFCEGNSVILNAPSGYASYRWSTGFSGRSLTVHSSGSYFCIVKNAEGQTGYSDTLQVVVHPIPKPQLVVTGNLPLCEGDTIRLDAGADFRSYLWSTGENTRQITVTQQGSYYVVVDNDAGCVGRSDTFDVETRPAPPKPTIDRTGDLLTTGKAPNYQWLLNGQVIPGATNQFHVARQTGTYQVRVANEYGCTSTSDALLVSVLGIENEQLPESPQIRVYPDPAHDGVTVAVEVLAGVTGGVWLVDVLGRADRIMPVTGERSVYRTTLDLAGRGNGLYHIVVQTSGGVHIRKFMKN